MKRGMVVISVACYVTYLLPRNQSVVAQGQSCTMPSNPDTSGIDHIVFIMMENRSFDHFLGWLPNADGQQNLTYYNDAGTGFSTYHLTSYGAGSQSDPAHAYENLHNVDWYFNGYGPNLGWLKNGQNTSHVAIGYYNETDVGFLGQMARQYTALDGYFSSLLSQTWANRKFAHTGQTDRLDNSNWNVSSFATIWDRLLTAGRNVAYYVGDANGWCCIGSDYLSQWYGAKYRSGASNITKTYTQFLSDAQNGTLPDVSYVDPGTCDDHPGDCDILQGDNWINSTVSAVMKSPQWLNSAVVITFDEAGGFFDHVPPKWATAPNPAYRPCTSGGTCETDMDGNGRVPLGFRVPTVVISPFSVGRTASPTVNHLVYDHTSILKLIEWRWHLTNLTGRDGSSDVNNLACAINAPNLLVRPGFEEFAVPALAGPGWQSDSYRQTPAVSDRSQPHTGLQNGKCFSASSRDCGMIQNLAAPTTGTYTFSIYANSDRTGGLVGANVNGTGVASQNVQVRGTGNYGAPYVMTFSANAGDALVVWAYSPATPGTLVIDDSVLTVVPAAGNNILQRSGFEEYSVPALGPPGWLSDTYRQTPAVSDTTQPHSGTKEGMCSTSTYLDCGIIQTVTAPTTGYYTMTFYANASRTGALIGANVNGQLAKSTGVQVRGAGNYGAPYIMTFPANAGDSIVVWMYSPASPGWAVIDDVTLYQNLLQRPSFEEYSVPSLGPPGWLSDNYRQTPAVSSTSQPHSGAKHGLCSTSVSLDCGIIQNLTAPSTGTYTLSFYANADRTGALIGANVNWQLAVSTGVQVRGSGNYGDPYVMTFSANAGDAIVEWMYSPATPGSAMIDDVSLTRQ